MRIGILTFHSQLNYGGVLQCWALQTALEKMGHEVVVLDLWRTFGNRALLGPFGSLSFKQWLKLIARSLVKGSLDFSSAIRYWRTIRFVRTKLHLTRFHFYQWADLQYPIDLDCVVVGSDQVWHCGDWGDPRPFLLEGAPPVPAIAYAASFGMRVIPQSFQAKLPNEQRIETIHAFKRGLSRFSAIGCREHEGIELCATLGFKAVHVCDPTLLPLSPTSIMGRQNRNARKGNKVVCYFLKEDIPSKIDMLDRWTKHMKWTADLFGPGDIAWHKQCCDVAKGKTIKLKVAAGPLQFLDALYDADACISDSFHALAISLLFGVNVRLLKPRSSPQKEMASRIEEFANSFCEGTVFCEHLSAALDSIASGVRTRTRNLELDAFRSQSQIWLASELEKISCKF